MLGIESGKSRKDGRELRTRVMCVRLSDVKKRAKIGQKGGEKRRKGSHRERLTSSS
jgi:hypothetical protein